MDTLAEALDRAANAIGNIGGPLAGVVAAAIEDLHTAAAAPDTGLSVEDRELERVPLDRREGRVDHANELRAEAG